MEIDPHILNDEPSTAVSTETLMGRDMAPEGLPASNKDPAPQMKMKKRVALKEWLYRRKEEDTATNEFRRYCTVGSAIPATERFDPIACPATSCECEQRS